MQNCMALMTERSRSKPEVELLCLPLVFRNHHHMMHICLRTLRIRIVLTDNCDVTAESSSALLTSRSSVTCIHESAKIKQVEHCEI